MIKYVNSKQVNSQFSSESTKMHLCNFRYFSAQFSFGGDSFVVFHRWFLGCKKLLVLK